MKKLRPDIIVPLTEQNSQENRGNSLKRNIEKTLQYLDYIIQEFQNDQESMIFAPIQGGQNLELRAESVKQSCLRDIQGLVLYGIHEQLSFQQRKELLDSILSNIPNTKTDHLVIQLHGSGEPVTILFGIHQGIHQFECFYPFEVAQQGKSFIIEESPEEFMDQTIINIQDFENKRVNLMDLNDKIYENDFTGIQQNCQCLACKEHTRAYIHHLLKCNEMTAHVLLTIHNLHSNEKLFATLHQKKQNNQLNQYISWFLKTQTMLIQ